MNLSRVLSYEKRKTLLINSIIHHVDSIIIAWDNKKRLVYTNDKANYPDYKIHINDLFIELMEKGDCEVIKHHKNQVSIIKGIRFSIVEEEFAVFYIEKTRTSLHSTDPAITITNRFDTELEDSKIMITTNEQLKKSLEEIDVYSKTINPIIITGEKGTGKDLLAHKLYRNGTFTENSFIIIDSDYMNEMKWTKLFEEENSFLTKSEITIYIKNMHSIDLSCQKLVKDYFMNTYIHKRNKLIFSYVSDQAKNLQNGYLLSFIQDELGAFQLIIPNLNERIKDISSLTSLFINEFILKYGKQVLGLKPAAITLLEEFNWIYNIDQLERVIEECIILTNGYYISDETVKRVLEKENNTPLYPTNSLNLNKTLDEITKDIITQILSQENFNQTKVAERLGISRSTLWRKLKV